MPPFIMLCLIIFVKYLKQWVVEKTLSNTWDAILHILSLLHQGVTNMTMNYLPPQLA